MRSGMDECFSWYITVPNTRVVHADAVKYGRMLFLIYHCTEYQSGACWCGQVWMNAFPDISLYVVPEWCTLMRSGMDECFSWYITVPSTRVVHADAVRYGRMFFLIYHCSKYQSGARWCGQVWKNAFPDISLYRVPEWCTLMRSGMNECFSWYITVLSTRVVHADAVRYGRMFFLIYHCTEYQSGARWCSQVWTNAFPDISLYRVPEWCTLMRSSMNECFSWYITVPSTRVVHADAVRYEQMFFLIYHCTEYRSGACWCGQVWTNAFPDISLYVVPEWCTLMRSGTDECFSWYITVPSTRVVHADAVRYERMLFLIYHCTEYQSGARWCGQVWTNIFPNEVN